MESKVIRVADPITTDHARISMIERYGESMKVTSPSSGVAEFSWDRPHGLAEVQKLYGKAGGALCKQGRVDFPEPIGLAQGFSCHVLAAPVFQAFFNAIHEARCWPTLKTFNGCYAFRSMRGIHPPRYSTHSWGIAIDLNAGRNGLGKTALDPPTYLTAKEGHGEVFYSDPGRGEFHAHPVVLIAREMGIKWGGDFKGRKDPMHFQLCTGY